MDGADLSYAITRPVILSTISATMCVPSLIRLSIDFQTRASRISDDGDGHCKALSYLTLRDDLV